MKLIKLLVVTLLVCNICNAQTKKATTQKIVSSKSMQKNQNKLFIEMISVKGGKIKMDQVDNKVKQIAEEEVFVKDFFISKYEVTQAQWASIMGNNPSTTQGDNLPVNNISWHDAQDFIQKLNEKTGKNYRLPTDVEWAYAARGGNKTKGYTYSGSNDLNEVAWTLNNSKNKLHEVGLKLPNEIGLYDMSGNVLEWCEDNYFNYDNPSEKYSDGRPVYGTADRVLRGCCSFAHIGKYCEVSTRNFEKNKYTGEDVGFRIAHSL